MNIARQNYFSLFSLEPGFQLDKQQLEKQYKKLQSEYHPDRFASANDQERREAMQLTSIVNDAFETLRSPLSRSAYLLELQGIEAENHQQSDLDTEFLMQQMQLRVVLEEEAEAENIEAIEALKAKTEIELQNFYQDFEKNLQEGQLQSAKVIFHKCQFAEKLLTEINHVEEKLLDY